MQAVEHTRMLIFVAIVFGVVVLAAAFLIQLVVEQIRGRPRGRRRFVWPRRVVLMLAVIGIGCIGYGRLIEPFWLEVTRVRVASPKLSRTARPVRIVQISDLHCDAAPRLEDRLPDVIAAERPDVIVFTGDSINTPDGLPILKRCLARLASIAPTFAVRGNWDTWWWSDIDLFGGTGVRELDFDTARLDVRGVSLWIAGAPAPARFGVGAALVDAPPDVVTVFLYHYPDEIAAVAERGIDLYLTGHTHGGQVALPFFGALVTHSKLGKLYESGRYRVGDTTLYVNRGIGMEGGIAPRVRFCARPEVTVIEIVAEK